MAETQWLPALVALAIGVVGGIAFLARSRARGATPARRNDGTLRLQLEEKIERLRLLAGDPDPAAAARRRSLELEAAGLLRAIDQVPVDAGTSSPALDDPNRPLRILLWVTGSSIAAAVVYFLLLGSLQTRQSGAPLTGDQSLVSAPRSAAEQSLRARVVANPDDLEARLALARMMLDENRLMEVHELVQSVLERDPENARAMSYEAMVLLAIDRAPDAEALLRRALTIDPQLLEGWLHLGLVHFRQGNLDQALLDLKQAKTVSPADARMIDALAAEMKRAASGDQGGTPEAQPQYAGTILVPDEALNRYRDRVLFVIVRPAGTQGGPPSAVKRLSVTSQSIAFSIGAGDSMAGAPLPPKASIEARIDADGNPLTREGEPGASTVAAAGQLNLQLALRP